LYTLNGTLADQLGGPSLVADGGTLGATRYTFGANQGLELTGALANTANYSIELVMEYDTLTNPPAFRKMIDFSQRMSDAGMYVHGSVTQFFPGANGADSVTAGTDFHFVFTRNAATNTITTYLNGVLQAVYDDSATSAMPLGNVLTFFEDDHA